MSFFIILIFLLTRVNILTQILNFLFIANIQNHIVVPISAFWFLSELRHACSNQLKNNYRFLFISIEAEIIQVCIQVKWIFNLRSNFNFYFHKSYLIPYKNENVTKNIINKLAAHVYNMMYPVS